MKAVSMMFRRLLSFAVLTMGVVIDLTSKGSEGLMLVLLALVITVWLDVEELAEKIDAGSK
jgi:hypothetical protein